MAKYAKKKKTGFLQSKKAGLVIYLVQMALSIVLLSLVLVLNVIPLKYLLLLVVLLLILLGVCFMTQVSRGHRAGGKIFSLIVSVVCLIGSYYILSTNNMLVSITGKDKKTDEISVVVLKESAAQSLSDTKSFTFGIQKTLAREKVGEAIDSFNEQLNTTLKTEEFDDFPSMVNALYDDGVQAIVINEAYRDTILEDFPDFGEKTRVLDSHKIVTEIDTNPVNTKITKTSFTVYISGNDSFGSLNRTGRSDVNIIVTVNPQTKQILLHSTPRDYFIPMPFKNNKEDKLTHAGNSGVDASIQALQQLYGITLNYYVRVNFTSMIGMVDALGGITVDSPKDFTTYSGDYHFTKGPNKMDGKKALAFSRERHAFANGDNQRGINQTTVIKAMLNKAMSPAILANYSSIMSGLAGSFETNMSSEELKSLVRMQMDDGASWNIVSNAVVGTGASKVIAGYGSKPLSITLPNQDSVDAATAKMEAVLNGETLQ